MPDKDFGKAEEYTWESFQVLLKDTWVQKQDFMIF